MDIILDDQTRPCPHCGVACTGVARFEYTQDGTTHVLEMNRDDFDLAAGSLVEIAAKDGTYSALPSVVRECNECTGWTDLDAGPTPVGVDDVLDTIGMCLAVEGGARSYDEPLGALRTLALGARSAGVHTLSATYD